MSTTIRPHFSNVAAQTPSTSVPTASATPVSIFMRDSIAGTSDFFPFHDLAQLGPQTSDNFSFKDLIQEGIDGSQDIDLFRTGCQVNGVSDCNIACSNTTYFFGSLETFYNCAALASIAYWTHEEGTYYVGPEAERNASVIMGDGTVASFDGRPVLQSFVKCAVESCDKDRLATSCPEPVKALSSSSTTEEIFEAMDEFCPNIKAEINPDIFGPGVLISYVLQVVFSASLYIFLKGFNAWVRFSQKPQEKKQKRLARRLTRIESMIWKDSSAYSRTSIAIATTLVEFQEAQCWFVFAVQIASILAIVVNSQEGTFWGEIIVNGAVAFHISQNGILPMFLIQICLHNEGIRNWHTFLGFCMEYLLAIVATTQRIDYKSSFELFRDQNSITACGGNPSPRTYCASREGVDGVPELSFFPHPLMYKLVFLVLDTVAMIVLVIDQLTWTLRTHHRTKHMGFGSYKVGRWPDGRLKQHWIKFNRWFWQGLEFAYLVINILYLVSLANVISPLGFEATRWSYGQIIAMTVWGPVIVKLFDLILSGPPKNGKGLNSGPPRLRIDNFINHRQGTSADDELDAAGYTPSLGNDGDSKQFHPFSPTPDGTRREMEADLEDGDEPQRIRQRTITIQQD